MALGPLASNRQGGSYLELKVYLWCSAWSTQLLLEKWQYWVGIGFEQLKA